MNCARHDIILFVLINSPDSVNSDILKFVEEIGTGTQPIFVRLRPEEDYIISDCFGNVKKHVAKFGGNIRFGWAVWEIPKVFLEAEFHAIWESPLGKLIDVTPRDDNETRILFLPDPKKTYDGKLVNNIRKSLKDTALTRSLIKVGDLNAAFRAKYQQYEYIMAPQEAVDALTYEIQQVGLQSLREARPNELCPCASGRKFKRCHGKR